MATPDAKALPPDEAVLKVVHEIHDTEISYHNLLQSQLDVIQEVLKDKRIPEETRSKLENYLKPYLELLLYSANAFKQVPKQPDAAVDQVCSEMLQLITEIGKAYIEAALQQKEFNDLCNSGKPSFRQLVLEAHRALAVTTDQNVRHDPNELTVLPIQRILRYKLLLEDLLRKTGERHPGHLKIKDALEAVATLSDQINKVQGAKSVKLSDGDKKIVALLKNSVTVSDTFEKNPGDVAKVAKIIRTVQAADIQKVLNDFPQYFCTKIPATGLDINIEAAKAIKQDFYYSLLDPHIENIVRKAMTGEGGKLKVFHAVNSSALKFDAMRHGYRSTTQYLIHQLNETLKNDPENKKKISRYLQKLGINQEKASKIAVDWPTSAILPPIPLTPAPHPPTKKPTKPSSFAHH